MWQYELQSIVDTLSAFCERTGRAESETFVWICFMCNNQVRIQETGAVPTKEFFQVFGGHLESIGHMVSLWQPWSAPANLKRAWYVY